MNALSDTMLGRIRPIMAAIKSVPVPVRPGGPRHEPAAPPIPFVTISRETGAGGLSLAKKLVEHLGGVDPAGGEWSCWDRELVEKVAQDCHVSQTLIDSLEEESHSWLEEFFAGMAAGSDQASYAKLFGRVAGTMRALAQAGRVVIVGRGGVFVTHDMNGGVHIRLVAPLEHRIEHMMHYLRLTRSAAAAYVKQTDKNREMFYRHFFPHQPLTPEMFALTLNTAEMKEEEMIRCIVPLVKFPVGEAVEREL